MSRETAVIRMVDEYEQTGTKMGFKQGWRLGWNRRAFRMWVIDLVISLPVIVFIALLIGLGLLVYFSVTSGPIRWLSAGRSLPSAARSCSSSPLSS